MNNRLRGDTGNYIIIVYRQTNKIIISSYAKSFGFITLLNIHLFPKTEIDHGKKHAIYHFAFDGVASVGSFIRKFIQRNSNYFTIMFSWLMDRCHQIVCVCVTEWSNGILQLLLLLSKFGSSSFLKKKNIFWWELLSDIPGRQVLSRSILFNATREKKDFHKTKTIQPNLDLLM